MHFTFNMFKIVFLVISDNSDAMLNRSIYYYWCFNLIVIWVQNGIRGGRYMAFFFNLSEKEKIPDLNEQCIFVIYNMFLENGPISIIVWLSMYLQWYLKANSVFETENLGAPRDKITCFDHINGIENDQLAFVYNE